MANSLLRTDEEIADIYERHVDMVYRVCYAFMKNTADAADAAQDSFLQLIKTGPVFENGEHEKAWLIRTASNLCKSKLRHWWRKRESLPELPREDKGFELDETFDAVMGLPDKYKSVILLYYYEGYDSVEISKLLRKPQSTIRYYLQEARKALREKLGDDFNEE